MSLTWAYCRVSTRKEEQEDSLDEQRDRAIAFATERHFELRLFTEQASAKSITGRPVISSLLAELETLTARNRPKYLFITALDRLSRDMVDGMYVGRMLRSLKVTLFLHGRGEVRLDTFAERALFVGESMGGDAENEAKSKRSRDSWDRRRREGKPTSNKVPYGLQLIGERDVPIVDSAEWVRKAFEWYAQGDGTHIIGKRMQGNAPPHTWLTSRIGEDGQRIQKTRAGTKWEALRVLKLLKQRRYRGTIVEPDLFDAVSSRLADTPKAGSRRKREYPLSGAMRCEGCGRHLHGRATGHSSSHHLADGTRKVYRRKPIRYYGCVVCGYMVNAERLERQFFSHIGELVGDPALLRRWIATPPTGKLDALSLKQELKRLQADVAEENMQARRDKLFSLAMTASLSEIEFKRQLNRLDNENTDGLAKIAAIRAKLATQDKHSKTIDHASSLLMRFTELYEGAAYELKRELVSSLASALGGVRVSRDGLKWEVAHRL